VLGVTDSAANTAALATGTVTTTSPRTAETPSIPRPDPRGSAPEQRRGHSDLGGSWEVRLTGLVRSQQSRSWGRSRPGRYHEPSRYGHRQAYTGRQPARPRWRERDPSTTYYEDLSDSTASFPTWGYDIYTIVPTAALAGFGGNAAIKSLFDGSTSVLCSSAAQTIATSSVSTVLRLQKEHAVRLPTPATADHLVLRTKKIFPTY